MQMISPLQLYCAWLSYIIKKMDNMAYFISGYLHYFEKKNNQNCFPSGSDSRSFRDYQACERLRGHS